MLSPLRISPLALLLFAVCLPAKAQTATWETGPPMDRARADAAAVVLGGSLYVIGGQTTTGQALGVVERFTPGEGWESVASLREERYAAAASVSAGQIVLMGGSETSGEAMDDVELYVPSENDWESFDNLTRERTGLGSVVLGGGVYALGGADGTFLSGCEYYDPDEEYWEPYTQWTLDPARASFGAARHGEAAYLAGGFSAFGPVALFERYDLNLGATPLAPLSAPRGRLALVSTGGALGGDLFAIGGQNADGVVAIVERYDISRAEWVTVAPLATARAGAAAVYLDGAIYVVGGEDAFGTALRTMEVYRLSTSGEESAPPATFALGGGYPNPFSDRTTLSFHLGTPGSVTVTAYDVQGRQVATLADRVMTAGEHYVSWNGTAGGRRLPAGIYVIQLFGPGGQATTKLNLLR